MSPKRNRIKEVNQQSISGIPEDVLLKQEEERKRLEKEKKEEKVRQEIQGKDLPDVANLPTIGDKTPSATIDDPKALPPPGTVETFSSSNTGRPSGVITPDGKVFLGLSPEDVATIAEGERQKVALPEGAAPVGTAQKQLRSAQEAQRLQGQVGQFGQLPVGDNPLLDFGEAARVGAVQGIPRTLTLLGGAAVAGAAIGTAAAPGVGTVIGAAVGLIGGLASSMISNFKSQRSDTTTAQQRVLDEGKQTMKDWATLAEADPTNKAFYLSEYNKVSAQIDQAYRQMKYDTQRDVAKFETALPNLAEFEAFYSAGGERNALNIEMRNALLVPASPEYAMLELVNRRGNNEK